MKQPYLLTTKELESNFGINSYDFGARHFDMTTGRWYGVDADAEDYYEHSPYNFCLNNPVKNVDLDGNGVWDMIVGATYAAVDDITGINLRGYHKPSSNEAAKDYNAGQDFGDRNMIAAGAAEAGGGSSLLEGSATATVMSGGLAIEVSGPGMALGAGMTAHGVMVTKNAYSNLTSQKGRVAVSDADEKQTFNGKQDTESKTSKEAFGKAKEQNGIPRSQQPEKTIKVDETSKGQKTGRQLREHQYTNSKGEKVSIRKDNPTKYGQGGTGDQGPHYNAGETGQKLKQHHNYGN